MQNYFEPLITNQWITETEIEQLFQPKLKSIIDESERPKYTTQEDKKIIFNAFDGLNPQDVKVLIIGQDPYPAENRAHGLAFSFKDGQPAQDSLKNIFSKLESDLNINNKTSNLTEWKNRGVLLLNTSLTLKNKKGHFTQWKPFINFVIQNLLQEKNKTNKPLVIMLWGNPANSIEPLKYLGKIKESEFHKTHPNILILRSSHPSNLGKRKSIFNNEVPAFIDETYTPFKTCNEFLSKHNEQPINWSTD